MPLKFRSLFLRDLGSLLLFFWRRLSRRFPRWLKNFLLKGYICFFPFDLADRFCLLEELKMFAFLPLVAEILKSEAL